jgi:hypothetical protein
MAAGGGVAAPWLHHAELMWLALGTLTDAGGQDLQQARLAADPTGHPPRSYLQVGFNHHPHTRFQQMHRLFDVGDREIDL